MKKTIITTSIFALFASAVMATEVKLESQSNVEIMQESSAHGRIAGDFSSKSVLMDGITYKDISLSLVNANKEISTQLHGGITRITAGTLTVNNTTFKDINMHSQYQVQGGAIYLNGVGAKAVITGSTFDTITSSIGDYTGENLSSASFAMGSAIISWQSDLSVSDTVFNNNKVVASQALQNAEGGAIYLMMTGKPKTGHTEGEKVSFTNVKFTNNRAENTANSYNSAGGAIIVQGRYDGVYDSTRSLTFTDTVFQNNQAGWGGAIYSDTQSMTFNVSAGKELAYTGNKSLDGDNAGGFIYMDVHAPNGGTTYKDVFATFNIAENAKLTIGDGREGYDSIAGESNSTINKTGVGSLVVNSSMEYFTGTLNVNAGTMEANNGLGAKAVNIANGATLNVGLTSTSLTSATVVNDGVLGLKRGTLADGDTITILSYSGEGKVNAFGGLFANGVFTAGKTATYTSESSAITVGSAESDVQTVSYTSENNNKLVLDFDVSGEETMTVNSITEVEASDAGNITGDFITGFSVDATYNGDLSVVLSAYVGEIEDVAKLLAWHKADGSDVWTKLEGKIEYDASTGFASIFVEGFSSYAFSQVPEPSTYAMIFGAIALGFVAYRRRK